MNHFLSNELTIKVCDLRYYFVDSKIIRHCCNHSSYLLFHCTEMQRAQSAFHFNYPGTKLNRRPTVTFLDLPQGRLLKTAD